MKDNYQGLEPKDDTSKQNLLYIDRKKRYMHKNLDLRTVVLLENESTMDIFCNPELAEDIKKVKRLFRLQSNGGKITIN